MSWQCGSLWSETVILWLSPQIWNLKMQRNVVPSSDQWKCTTWISSVLTSIWNSPKLLLSKGWVLSSRGWKFWPNNFTVYELLMGRRFYKVHCEDSHHHEDSLNGFLRYTLQELSFWWQLCLDVMTECGSSRSEIVLNPMINATNLKLEDAKGMFAYLWLVEMYRSILYTSYRSHNWVR